MKKRICAACGKQILLSLTKEGRWCKNCNVYLCHNCMPKYICRVCGQPVNVSALELSGGLMAIMGSIFLITGMIPIYAMELDESKLENMSYTPIWNIKAGDNVKINGLIISNYSPVLSCYLVYTPKEEQKWYTMDFLLAQGNMTVLISASIFNGKSVGKKIRDGPGANCGYYPFDNVTVIGRVFGSPGNYTITPDYIVLTSSGFRYDNRAFYLTFGTFIVASYTYCGIVYYIFYRRRYTSDENSSRYAMLSRNKSKAEDSKQFGDYLLSLGTSDSCSVCKRSMSYLGDIKCIVCNRSVCLYDSIRAKGGEENVQKGYCIDCYKKLLKENKSYFPTYSGTRRKAITIAWISKIERQMAGHVIGALVAPLVMGLIGSIMVGNFILMMYLIAAIVITFFIAALIFGSWSLIRGIEVVMEKKTISLRFNRQTNSIHLKDIREVSFIPTKEIDGKIEFHTNRGKFVFPNKESVIPLDIAFQILGNLVALGILLDEKTSSCFSYGERFKLDSETYKPCPKCGDPIIKRIDSNICYRCNRPREL